MSTQRWAAALCAITLLCAAGCGKSEVELKAEAEAKAKEALKAKTAEAIDNLDKIYKGAVVYFSTPMISRSGQKLPCQFPAKTECSPATNPCDNPDKKFKSNPDLWGTKTWSSLSFKPGGAHYYRYCFSSSGTLKNATATITAHADLDCNGTWSTFQRTLYADPSSNFAECSTKSTGGKFVDKELE